MKLYALRISPPNFSLSASTIGCDQGSGAGPFGFGGAACPPAAGGFGGTGGVPAAAGGFGGAAGGLGAGGAVSAGGWTDAGGAASAGGLAVTVGAASAGWVGTGVWAGSDGAGFSGFGLWFWFSSATDLIQFKFSNRRECRCQERTARPQKKRYWSTRFLWCQHEEATVLGGAGSASKTLRDHLFSCAAGLLFSSSSILIGPLPRVAM